MRWPIRAQLLLPVTLLLAGTAAISFWTGWASAHQARQKIEAGQREQARFLSEDSRFPLTEAVLHWLKSLSGSDYLFIPQNDEPRMSLPGIDLAKLKQTCPITSDWRTLGLGEPVRIAGRTYLCSGIRISRPTAVGTLYILYPESLWRDARWEAIRPSLILGISVGIAALALALVQVARLGRRLRELDRRTRLIAAGDFGPMPLPNQDDELRDLAISVNEMAAQLARFQKTVEQTERFRLLGQISGGLAHQLRNGLTGARLAVQLYLHEQSGDTSVLEVALRQLTLLETHVKRFLDLGRTGPSRREPCELAALVTQAVELLRPQCRHAGIDLSWEPPEENFIVNSDAGQLGQVLVNLLGNAVEAAGPGGKVGVRITRVAHEAIGPGCATDETTYSLRGSDSQHSAIRVEVWDSGSGPPPEVADRLFEPFVTSKSEGVGLGLAMAKRVVEDHGGRIGWSRENDQTRFYVELQTPEAGETPRPDGRLR